MMQAVSTKENSELMDDGDETLISNSFQGLDVESIDKFADNNDNNVHEIRQWRAGNEETGLTGCLGTSRDNVVGRTRQQGYGNLNFDIKINVPNFDGKSDTDGFIDWLNRVDKMFAFKKCVGQRAVTLVETRLEGYALNWWENIQQLQVSGGYDYITDWEVMKGEMMTRFNPGTYEGKVLPNFKPYAWAWVFAAVGVGLVVGRRPHVELFSNKNLNLKQVGKARGRVGGCGLETGFAFFTPILNGTLPGDVRCPSKTIQVIPPPWFASLFIVLPATKFLLFGILVSAPVRTEIGYTHWTREKDSCLATASLVVLKIATEFSRVWEPMLIPVEAFFGFVFLLMIVTAGTLGSPVVMESKTVEDIGDVIREGGGALAKGLFRGVTGILTKPLEGAKSSGVEGFVQGVGRGIIGAAAQPVSGVLDLLSKTTEGANAVRMKIISAITSEEQLLRRRFPRVIGGDNLLRPYDEYKAQGQVILQLAECGAFFGQVDLFKVRGKFALSDSYENHFLLPKGKILIVTHRRVILLQLPSNIMAQKKFNPARDPCSVLWEVLWADLLTMEVTHTNKDHPKEPPSLLIFYLQTRSPDSKEQTRIIKCDRESEQALEIYSSVEQAMNTYGPNHSKEMRKKKVTKPYSPNTDGSCSEVTSREGVCNWSTQQVPAPVPLSSTFGSSTI
ncbi:hypothetical protein GIB67_011309 [Kingdonia uniflora]|uniref:Intermembrane lipid transfer protein VPS13-like C-terminal domain-containing protein n=1 Tax=Kingdonia uniflora TaxID=39325 RepID=A0A7J7MP74_9MAGN|nr:hypothetical protein GIB67_011309 [Kingdonia uniflora]